MRSRLACCVLVGLASWSCSLDWATSGEAAGAGGAAGSALAGGPGAGGAGAGAGGGGGVAAGMSGSSGHGGTGAGGAGAGGGAGEAGATAGVAGVAGEGGQAGTAAGAGGANAGQAGSGGQIGGAGQAGSAGQAGGAGQAGQAGAGQAGAPAGGGSGSAGAGGVAAGASGSSGQAGAGGGPLCTSTSYDTLMKDSQCVVKDGAISNPWALRYSDDYLYWTSSNESPKEATRSPGIHRIHRSLDGNTMQTVVLDKTKNSPRDLRVVGNSVYFADRKAGLICLIPDRSVLKEMKCVDAGGLPVGLITCNDHLVWTVDALAKDGSGAGRVYTIPLSGGLSTVRQTLAPSLLDPTYLTCDKPNDRVYVSMRNSLAPYPLVRIDLATATVVTMSTYDNGAVGGDLTFAHDRVYWRASSAVDGTGATNGWLFASDASGAVVHHVKQLGNDTPRYMALGDEQLFLTSSGLKKIQMTTLPAASALTDVVTYGANTGSPHGIAVDDAYVYWVDYGNHYLLRHARP